MHAVSQAVNPFALLTDPEAIFRAVEASPHLEQLSRRICRPLDRLPREGGEAETDALADVQPHEAAINSQFAALTPAHV